MIALASALSLAVFAVGAGEPISNTTRDDYLFEVPVQLDNRVGPRRDPDPASPSMLYSAYNKTSGFNTYGINSERGKELEKLLSDLRFPQVQRRPRVSALTHSIQYRSMSYKFGVDSRLIEEINLFSIYRGEYSYDILRGYWEDYGETKIFWGAGIRVKFSVFGYEVFGNGHFSLRWIDPVDNNKKKNPLIRVYGLPAVSNSLGEYISGENLVTVLKRMRKLVDGAFQRDFSGVIQLVEPVYIRLPRDEKVGYLANAQRNNQFRKGETIRAQRTDYLKSPKQAQQ